MTPLFKKLNLGHQDTVYVLNAPPSFEAELDALSTVAIKRSLSDTCSFVIAFAVTQAELDSCCERLANACQGDAVLWIAYPKASSKKYRGEFTRDSGWSVLGAHEFEPVRQVAIDEDWTALRFRRTEYIKQLTRKPGSTISISGGKHRK